MAVYRISKNLQEMVGLFQHLEGLDTDTRQQLVTLLGKPDRLQPGDERKLDFHSAFTLLGGGKVQLYHDGRRDREVEVPHLAGMLEYATRFVGRMHLQAVEAVDCWEISLEQFDEVYAQVAWVQDYLRRFYELELQRLAREKWELERHLDDFFLPRNAGLVPGPYRASPVTMYTFLMKEERSKLAAMLPPGQRLMPRLEERYLLVFADFQNVRAGHDMGAGRSFSYREAAVFIPCWSVKTGFGWFCPELYPDNYLAIALGRELYGFPKRFGIVDIEDEDSPYSAELLLGGRATIEARWEQRRSCSKGDLARDLAAKMPLGPRLQAATERGTDWLLPEDQDPIFQELWPSVPLFVRHMVPAIAFPHEQEPVRQTDRLIRIPFQVSNLLHTYRLEEPSVVFPDDCYPVQGTCLAAHRFQIATSFGESRVVRRYDRGYALLKGPLRAARHRLERVRTLASELRRALLDGGQAKAENPLLRPVENPYKRKLPETDDGCRA